MQPMQTQPDKKNFSIELLSAVFTWAIVSGSSLYFMISSGNLSKLRITLTIVLYAAYIVLWLACTRDTSYRKDKATRGALILGLFAIVISLYFLSPFTYNAILAVMLCSILPYVVRFKTALLLSPLFAAPLWLIYGFYWEYTNTLLTAVLFWTFNLFALVMINSMLKERESSEALSAKNRELMATQSLLKEATQQSERIRIARNIHDLLGHHLTALTIKLQVAERITDGDAQQQIAECHSLAKLLLSDVREAVTEIRTKSGIDISNAINSIASATPRLGFAINIDKKLSIQNVAVAEIVLRTIQECITNTLKHSVATYIEISLNKHTKGIELTIQDNNKECPQTFQIGNGLKGIQERVEENNGVVEFNSSANGFSTRLILGQSA